MNDKTENKRILLASFPHSGSNWLAYIIMNAFNIEVKGANERYSVKAKSMDNSTFRGLTVFKSHLHCFDEPEPQSYAGMIFCSREPFSAIRSYVRNEKNVDLSDYSQGKSPQGYGEERPDVEYIRSQAHSFPGEMLHLQYEKLIDKNHIIPTLSRLQEFFSLWAYAPFDFGFPALFDYHFSISLRDYHEHGHC